MEQAVAVPYCTSKLADAGARVIKLERETGDFARGYDSVAAGSSSYFVWLNRGKESLVIDIKNEKDKEFLYKLIAKADVFLQNLAPGAMSRAGFGSEELRKINEKLITVDVSGYGENNSYRSMKAYDLLIQAESGLCSVTGTPDGPGRVGISVCDITCGSTAYSAILEALIDRGKTGKGKGIELSLFSCISDWMNVPLIFYENTGKAPSRNGLEHPSVCPYGAFKTKEDTLILISIQNEREFQDLCTHFIGEPDLTKDERFATNIARVKNRKYVDDYVGKVFAKYTSKECVEKLTKAKTAYGFVNDVEGLSNHPALNKIKIKVHGGGEVEIAAPGASFSDGAREYGSVPAIGEHTEKIKKEFS